MNLRNVLWTYSPRKDGTCHIRIYFHHQGKKKYFGTGLHVSPKDWDDANGVVKKTHPLADRYNASIRQQRIEIEKHILDGGTWRSLEQKSRGGASLNAFGWKIIEEAEQGRIPLRLNTIKSYKSTLRKLDAFSESQVAFDDVDQNFYDLFTEYLSKEGCGLPGIGKHIKVIKRLMNMALERELHANTAHQRKSFKIHRAKPGKKVYLTELEIRQLERLDLSEVPFLEQERDRWLIAYHFMMRFSDVEKLGRSNFMDIGGKLYCKYRSIKTGVEAIVPVKERAQAILEKYDYSFAFSTNQHANRQIKTIVAMAGINEMVTQSGRTAPKSKFVTTHTARRSAATNLYLNKASFELIAKLGGWESGDSVRVYLQASGLDSALLAGGMEFFR